MKNIKLFLHKEESNVILYAFMILAVSIRLIFWLYTGRIWEDALITLTGVENVWDGLGLTHHISEPRVHYFTSPMSVLIPIVLHPIFGGLLGLRLVSLVAAIGTIYMAYQICISLNFKPIAISFALAFLSFDFLHIFFGMTGMETQVSVYFMLMAMRYVLKITPPPPCTDIPPITNSDSVLLGVALGFCMLSRPDFILPCICIGIWLLFNQPKHLKMSLIQPVIIALVIYLPWIIFATAYYGSPIPNTITAKSGGVGISTRLFSAIKDPMGMLEYFLSTWKVHAPIYEWWFIGNKNIFFEYTSILSVILQFFLILTSIIGLMYGFIKEKGLFIFVAIFLVFTIYRIAIVQNTYFMWYLPPFTAIMAIVIAAGINSLTFSVKPIAAALSIFLSVSYLLPLPFMFKLEKQAQIVIESGVRQKVGERLSVLMGDEDTVALEPLGFIGYYARNKTIYDYPGLGSKIALQAYRNTNGFGQFCNLLKPTFLALRKGASYGGVSEARQHIPDFDNVYELIETVETPISIFYSGPFYINRSGDDAFMIYRRSEKQINYSLIIELLFPDNIKEIVSSYDISSINLNNGTLVLLCGEVDPQIVFPLQEPLNKPHGNAFVQITCTNTIPGEMQIFFDYGLGHTGENSVRQYIGAETTTVIFPIVEWKDDVQLLNIRVDPPNGTLFSIRKIEFVEGK